MLVSAADYHIKYNPKHIDSPAVTDMLPSMSKNWNTFTYQRFSFKEDRSAEKDKETRQRHTVSGGIQGLLLNHLPDFFNQFQWLMRCNQVSHEKDHTAIMVGSLLPYGPIVGLALQQFLQQLIHGAIGLHMENLLE